MASEFANAKAEAGANIQAIESQFNAKFNEEFSKLQDEQRDRVKRMENILNIREGIPTSESRRDQLKRDLEVVRQRQGAKKS